MSVSLTSLVQRWKLRLREEGDLSKLTKLARDRVEPGA
jgi:hypothetical protein